MKFIRGRAPTKNEFKSICESSQLTLFLFLLCHSQKKKTRALLRIALRLLLLRLLSKKRSLAGGPLRTKHTQQRAKVEKKKNKVRPLMHLLETLYGLRKICCLFSFESRVPGGNLLSSLCFLVLTKEPLSDANTYWTREQQTLTMTSVEIARLLSTKYRPA